MLHWWICLLMGFHRSVDVFCEFILMGSWMAGIWIVRLIKFHWFTQVATSQIHFHALIERNQWRDCILTTTMTFVELARLSLVVVSGYLFSVAYAPPSGSVKMPPRPTKNSPWSMWNEYLLLRYGSGIMRPIMRVSGLQFYKESYSAINYFS